MELYERLRETTREIQLLSASYSVLQWDMQTYMPPGALKQRTEQHAFIRLMIHRMLTDGERVSLIENLEISDELNPEQRREVFLARRWLNQYITVPEDLVKAEAKQRVLATRSWNIAKKANNWKLFESDLIPLLEISKRKAEHMMKGIETTTPYDALLDATEPGLTTVQVEKLFNELRKKLVPLVQLYSELSKEVRMDFVSRNVPVMEQKRLATDLASIVGFDTTSDNAIGRIDEVEHPFSSGYYDDVRLNVKYVENELMGTIFGTLHEAGHCLYKMNKNPKWKWMGLGENCSAGVSESQARFVENIIGRSPEFWDYYYPRFQECTSEVFNDISLEEFVQSINIVKPSKIRVLADEMTHSLHIIIRFEIELDLFNDKIQVSDIPEIWNDKYQEYLGITIENDSEGALQDTHWAWAYWGYFPNYCLGNLYNSILLEQLDKDIPDWRDEMTNGRLDSPLGWLREKVHLPSNRYDAPELFERICGKSLSAEPFIKYLKEKYSSLFG
ncbi:MAG: carboxypeptidase M32 [Candidatus Thorarchaeota archaeon]